MKIISAFAGLGGAELALKRANITANIFAYEIDKYAEAVNRYHNPNSIFLGDINNWNKHTNMIGKIDLLIGGSPCTDLSCAGKCEGLYGKQSRLFYVFLEMLKYYQPKYFVLENVASMSNKNKQTISELVGVEPIMLNAALVSAQQRKRYFWTNIPISELPNKNIVVKDILEKENADYVYVKDKLNVITASYNQSLTIQNYFFNNRPYLFKNIDNLAPERIGHINNSTSQANRVYSINNKTVNINANGGGGGAKTGLYKIDLPDGNYIIRKLTPIEVERAFTIPDNYTKYGKFADGSIKEISDTQRYKMLGNGFVIDVIVEGILKNIE